MVNIHREVFTFGCEPHDHRGSRLLRIMQIVPLISEFVTEAVRSFSTDARLKRLDDLLPIIEAVQRSVLDGNQDISDRLVIKEISRLWHLKNPRSSHTCALKRQ